MENVLLAVAVLSGAVAVVMCGIVIRMMREERRRAEARVEALLAMAAEAPEAQRDEPPDRAPGIDSPLASSRSTNSFSERDLQLHIDPGVDVPGLFAEQESTSAWPRRIVAAAGVAAILVAVAVALGLRHDGTMESEPRAQGATTVDAPLELLSLAHTAAPGALTITGLVQNPRGGGPVANAAAVTFLFAQDGGFLASGRAPLDFTRLEPGQNSPFVVTVPVKGAVARYRVSFRSPDGAVIAHVDRRAAGPIAQKQSRGAP